MPTPQQVAERLRDAYRNAQIPPLRDGLDPDDSAGAYNVQLINTRFWQAGGRRIIGRKIGLTSKAVQAQLGVDQPDFGVLFEDMRISDGGVLRCAAVLQPKVEAEVALVLGKDVEPEGSPEQIADATAYAVAAIEIVDSRIANWKITFADTVADNGSSGFFVLGSQWVDLKGLDLYTCGMVLEIDGAVASVGAGAACLGHPLKAASWLARTLFAAGEGLKAGDIVLTGALGPMVALTPGERVRARVAGLGTVSFSYQE